MEVYKPRHWGLALDHSPHWTKQMRTVMQSPATDQQNSFDQACHFPIVHTLVHGMIWGPRHNSRFWKTPLPYVQHIIITSPFAWFADKVETYRIVLVTNDTVNTFSKSEAWKVGIPIFSIATRKFLILSEYWCAVWANPSGIITVSDAATIYRKIKESKSVIPNIYYISMWVKDIMIKKTNETIPLAQLHAVLC